MSVKDYVDLEGRIKLLQQMKTERLGYTVSLNRINALIKLCDSKFNKETNEIAKLFNITESNVHSLINETNKSEYTKLGKVVCSNWAATFSETEKDDEVIIEEALGILKVSYPKDYY